MINLQGFTPTLFGAVLFAALSRRNNGPYAYTPDPNGKATN